MEDKRRRKIGGIIVMLAIGHGLNIALHIKTRDHVGQETQERAIIDIMISSAYYYNTTSTSAP